MAKENELQIGDLIDIGGFITTLEDIAFDPMAKCNLYWFYNENGEYKYNLVEFIDKVPEIKPSMFTIIPWASPLQKMECEIIAKNIMVILKRTGDTFRDLSWKEYEEERLKDKGFSDKEKTFFEQVVYLAKGDLNKIIRFSKYWRCAYEKELKKQQI